MSETNLNNTNLSSASLTKVYAANANANGVDLSNAVLDRADFTNSDLSNANLSGSLVSRTTFENANLAGANFDGSVVALQVRVSCVNARIPLEKNKIFSHKTVENLINTSAPPCCAGSEVSVCKYHFAERCS